MVVIFFLYLAVNGTTKCKTVVCFTMDISFLATRMFNPLPLMRLHRINHVPMREATGEMAILYHVDSLHCM